MAADKMQLEGLAALVKDMEAKANNMETILKNCNSEVQKFNSGEGIWDGNSATQFQNRFEELSEQIPGLIAQVIAAANALATATGAFAAADESLKG